MPYYALENGVCYSVSAHCIYARVFEILKKETIIKT